MIFLPFWAYFTMAIFGIFYFSIYFEAFAVLLISDLIYGVKISKLFDITFSTGLVIFALLLLAEEVKKHSKFYRKQND